MYFKFVSNIDKFNNFEDRTNINFWPTVGTYIMNKGLKYEITSITLDYEKGAAEFYCDIPRYLEKQGQCPKEVIDKYLQ